MTDTRKDDEIVKYHPLTEKLFNKQLNILQVGMPKQLADQIICEWLKENAKTTDTRKELEKVIKDTCSRELNETIGFMLTDKECAIFAKAILDAGYVHESEVFCTVKQIEDAGFVKKENLTLDEDKLVEIISDEMCCQTIDECAMTRTTAKAIASQAGKVIKEKEGVC